MSDLTRGSSAQKAVLLFGHGSPVAEANDVLRDVARSLMASGGYTMVEPAFLQFEEPGFHTALERIVESGAKEVIITPYFLYRGSHIRKDLPALIDEAARRHPALTLTLAPTLGFHPKLIEVALERIEEAGSAHKGSPAAPAAAQVPHAIERESYAIIEKGLGDTVFSGVELAVVKRVIHATADFDYKDLMRFSPGAVRAGISALRGGRNIVTDVRMVEAGVRREGFSGRVLCFTSNWDVKRGAREGSATRTALSMRKGARFMEGGIAVVGNAPTALKELLALIRAGRVRPGLVIGVPVGFVGARESKEELMGSGVEFISSVGTKGGSAVAVSIVNALIIEAGAERCLK